MRVKFQDGEAGSIEPFLTFSHRRSPDPFCSAHGLAFAKDGSLLMVDDANEVLYRIAHEGKKDFATKPLVVPADELEKETAKGVGVALALARDETGVASQQDIRLSSKSYAAGSAIPQRYSEYYDGVSPELSWTAVQGAASYAIVEIPTPSRSRHMYTGWHGISRPPC